MTDELQHVYINGMGAFLPGNPVTNDDMESHLGKILGKPSALRKRILRQNGIKQRYYAIDREQKSLYRNSEMAALACKNAIEDAKVEMGDIEVLACATTQGDLVIPGFGSMVHGELKNPSCEVASLAGVCASGLSALKYGYQQVRSGDATTAVCCASEFASRLFKASRYEAQDAVDDKGRLGFDTEFLRWMLSDGAGAAVLSPKPSATGLSLKIDWIKLRSHADKHDVCMFSGSNGSDVEQGNATWIDQPSFEHATSAGMLNLKQDTTRLDTMVKVGVEMFLDLVEKGDVAPDQIDWLVCHYSSEIFKGQIDEMLGKCGIHIDDGKWFSNLHRKGNIGSASIYVMLEELFKEAPLKEGQNILCMVPESGRFTAGYMMLTVTGQREEQADVDENPEPVPTEIHLNVDTQDLQSQLVRRLAKVWLEFDGALSGVPLVRRIEQKRFTLEDYRMLLMNWRQQVIEGGRWIARAASSIENDFYELRSLFIHHAKDEHMDFRMLEQNFVKIGGDLKDIQAGDKNIGSEALSAFIFHRASQPNPLDLMGTMFIIEGLGLRKAYGWGKAIKKQLNLDDEAVSFFLYHGKNDENHFERLEEAIRILNPDQDLVDRIVKTAKVTARLYRLQLEEMNQF